MKYIPLAPGSACDALQAQSYQQLRLILHCVKNLGEEFTHETLFNIENIHIFNLAAKLGDKNGLRVCLSAGLSPNKAYNGFYPLHSAALHGKTEACELLCAFGADINVQGGKENTTAIMLAAINSRFKTIRRLKALGADITLRSNRNQTVVDILERQSRSPHKNEYEKECFRQLLSEFQSETINA